MEKENHMVYNRSSVNWLDDYDSGESWSFVVLCNPKI